MVEAPGGIVPFSLKPILVDLEGGRYIGQILPVSLADLVAGRGSAYEGAPKSGGGGGGSRAKKTLSKMSATGGTTQVKVSYDTQLPSLSLRDGENSRSILAGAVLPTLRGHVLYKNWNLCGVFWEDCKRKKSHVHTPP